MGFIAAVLALRAAAAADAVCDAAAPSALLQPAAASVPAHAQAVWLDARTLRWPGAAAPAGERFRLLFSERGRLDVAPGRAAQGIDAALALRPSDASTPAPAAPWVGAGVELALPRALARERLAALHRGQLVVVREDALGRVLAATQAQHALALDALYADAADAPDAPPLGAQVERSGSGWQTVFRVWAPTARRVSLCLYPEGNGSPALARLPMRRDDASGVWTLRRGGDLTGRGYAFVAEVHVRGHGRVRNRVSDPYAVTLGADSQRSVVLRMDAPAATPPGWAAAARPAPLAQATDLSVYELHVRDFSRDDASVPPALRGRYAAFALHLDGGDSEGLRHLRRLAAAGVTDVHLLPAFDLATVPERGCRTPEAAALKLSGPAGRERRDAVRALAAQDCFNWGYDPWHFNAPEGSYASDAADGAVRVREFRRMVQGLHALGLRVGMDVVYNHTSASGQDAKSVLDRLVPDYYHRLDAEGRVERSTCCENTATEHRMMARLMVDSAVHWVRHLRIDSFRFDLMGHQPRAAMERLQRAVDAAAGRRVPLIGEGWNFGEVADGRRFVQASQLAMGGSGIATFSDRARDAARGGGAGDDGASQVLRQGWISGLAGGEPNELQTARAAVPTRADALRAADLVRAGLAGTLRDYAMETAGGAVLPLSRLDYAGQPAGYVQSPGEVVNYVENHDNQTLWDALAFKLPLSLPAAERARLQVLGNALVAFSQGIAYWHAGQELLRSKSMDRNSYDSGDAFNRLDWTAVDNGFAAGLPPEAGNAESEALIAERLALPALKPAPEHIRFARDATLDLMRIRASTPLFRLASAADVQRRLVFHNTGPSQDPALIVGHLDGRGLAGAAFAEVLYVLNAAPGARTVEVPALRGRAYRLHPVQAAPGAAEHRAREATWDAAAGRLTVPGRSAVVWVADAVPGM